MITFWIISQILSVLVGSYSILILKRRVKISGIGMYCCSNCLDKKDTYGYQPTYLNKDGLCQSCERDTNLDKILSKRKILPMYKLRTMNIMAIFYSFLIIGIISLFTSIIFHKLIILQGVMCIMCSLTCVLEVLVKTKKTND